VNQFRYASRYTRSSPLERMGKQEMDSCKIYNSGRRCDRSSGARLRPGFGLRGTTSDNSTSNGSLIIPRAPSHWRPGYQLLQTARRRSELHREHWQCAWGSTRRSHPGQTIGPGLGGGGVVDVIAAATGAGLVAGVVVCVAPAPTTTATPAMKTKATAPRMRFFTRTPIIWGTSEIQEVRPLLVTFRGLWLVTWSC
jgi:hypothetical protein